MSQAVLRQEPADYSEHLARLEEIPTLPLVAMKVTELLNDPQSSSADVASILEKDQALTAKILKLANSSYYSIPGGVTDVQRALSFLGFNTIAQLILGLSVVSVFSKLEMEDLTLLDFWKHALGVAVASEVLAKRLGFEKPEEAFTCGLLHDVGKLVLHEIDLPVLNQILREAKEKNCSFTQVEEEQEVVTHTFLGEAIAQRWGLPASIQNVARYHHASAEEMSHLEPSEKKLISLVSLANRLCVKNQLGHAGDYSNGEILDRHLEPLGISFDEIEEIESELEIEMEKAGAFLGVFR